MILEARCDKCGNRVFDVDTDLLDFPFSSEMFPQGAECLNSRVWTFPAGPVTMELTCPQCGGFPFEFRDGVPTGRIQVKDPNDNRFLISADWREITTKKPYIVESMPITNFNPKGKKNVRHQIMQ